MDSSSSSKVTVEYHDPAGIFPLVSPSIASRLPLRNLNWQSPSRPLRQIKSLHLDFVPDDFTRTSLRPPTAQTDLEASNSFDIVRTGAGANRKDGKERRHQIPGLQTSPYLKIYVLRCDDKDAYKATERAKIRQWIRDNAASTSSNRKKANQNENHTASEYLILHVVIPDTIAASEPRWRESQREPEELKERKQGAKWPGKSTRTVFDKLRADFNDSSSTDRVAQLRLSKDHVPADLLPTPAQAVTYNETAEEQGKTWNDILTKLKSLILVPFDKRVRQYEQDIAEQESRRSLPGFNFCTFFIHKEGLARALEAIGLVEDALVIYDELSLGLESVLRDLASGQAEGTATTFAEYTDDVKERILGEGSSKSNSATGHNREDSGSVDAGEIDYRERIVRSNISVFDFQCYLFGRRKALILRLANAAAARRQLGAHTKEGGEDLVLISEVCWRGSNFLHNTARVLRQDLLAAKAAGKDEFTDTDVAALVSSWLYTAAGQLLDETNASALDPQPEHARKPSLKSPPNGTVTSPRRSEFADLGQAYPQRTTSLPSRKSRVSELQKDRASVYSASEETLVSPPSSSGTDGTKVPTQVPGLPELVAYRAELVMMRRKMLEQLAAQRGWLAGWTGFHAKRSRMETVDLNGSSDKDAGDEGLAEGDAASTLLPATLASSLLSEEVFHECYDRLADQAMRYYHSATQNKSAEAIVGDLAVLKYQQGDYDFAAKYFEHVLPAYKDEGWGVMEAEAMQILRVCWRELGKKNEELATVLDMLEKQTTASKQGHVGSLDIDNDGLLSEAVAISKDLEKEVVVPASKLFSELTLDREVVHFEDHDGFAVNVSLQHHLDDEATIDEAVARLVHVEDPNQELRVMSSKPFILRRGCNEVQLESSVTAFGAYLVDSVILKAKNIHFTHDFGSQKESEATPPDVKIDEAEGEASKIAGNKPWIFVYPAQRALDVDVKLARDVHIDKPRHLEIHLSSASNDIQSLDLRLKPASAGLRLHLADAQHEGLQRREDGEATPGMLHFGPMATDSSSVITLPYSIDHPSARELIVHLTAQYRSSNGRSCTFISRAKLPTELPLDVDVNDIFHDDALFSSFTIRATSQSPLIVSEAILHPSKAYDVEAPPALGSMTVFDKHPASLAYKITRKQDGGAGEGKPGKKDVALALDVKYVAMDQLIADKVRHTFNQALERSPFSVFRRLLSPLLISRSRQLISKGEIEISAFLGEARLPKYKAVGWDEIVNTLPSVIRSDLAAWLQQWHEDNASVTLDLENIEQQGQRSITISVEVPVLDFVHRAAIAVLDPLHELDDGGGQVLALGEPVNAELTIASTTDWSRDSIFGSKQDSATSPSQQPQAFMYDIHAESESWLIGGPKRGHLDASHDSEATFSITLIPLKLGPLLLPQVDVQPVAANSGDEGSGEAIRCETHCASAGLVVKVIKDQRKTRVHIPEPTDDHARAGSGTRTSSGRPGTAETVREAG